MNSLTIYNIFFMAFGQYPFLEFLHNEQTGTDRDATAAAGLTKNASTTTRMASGLDFRHSGYRPKRRKHLCALCWTCNRMQGTRCVLQESSAAVRVFSDECRLLSQTVNRVDIRGLCSIYIKKCKLYTGRNPKPGEKDKIRAKELPFFKAGEDL